jgi:predicted aspartyl protease
VQTKSLADTGANGYLVIDKPFAIRLSKALQSPIRKLPYSVPVRGYQRNIQSNVSEYIRLHLTVEGRRIYNCPFVLLNLGTQDVIIGKKLFSRFRILLDSAKNRLVWPKEYPPTPSWSKEITLPYHSRETSFRHPAYQSDANRRDLALHREDRRRAGGRSMDMKVITPDSEEITDTPSGPTRNQEVLPLPQKRIAHGFTPVQICEISANAFHHEMMRSDSEFFQTSIYEIDQVIRERELEEDEETLHLIRQKLPHMHRRYADVFSKSESDRIPPHRIYDHKLITCIRYLHLIYAISRLKNPESMRLL